jgi:hypothetical protein
MKIALIDKNINLSRGSYRIHINDLCFYFNKIGIYSEINPKNISLFNIHIYGKDNNISKTNNKIGIITPSCDNILLLTSVDFIIVGSSEEKDSIIKYNKNCFIFPLIENMYLDVIPKIHYKKEEIIIGYHGNQNHLNHMDIGLKNALERLSKEIKLKFIYICQNDKEWIKGKPKINIEYKKWDIKTIIKDIQEFDIGIVPNISEYEINTLNKNLTLGIYNTDYKIRFKNKSNIGRALVLFQCGIPVIADITPSNMHILANPDNGYAVLSEDGWYNAIKELCCENHRNFISKNAYEECKRLYNPFDWAQKLINKINKI